jgi:uncharacterized protein (TIGR02391 family)
MAKPSGAPAPQSSGQMRAVINRFKGLIGDLERFDPHSVQARSDPQIKVLAVSIDEALMEAFGHQTPHYVLYKPAASIDTARHNYAHEVPRGEIIEGLVRGKDRAIALLGQAVRSLEEKLADLGEPDNAGAKTLRAYEGLDLHPAIARAANDLYRDGHYANAIEDAVKALNNLVRLHSGEDGDGTSLMETVFSPKKPILRFNDARDQSDHDEQKGFMMMFSGAVAGLRNPRAHRLIKDDPERALEFIAFVSLLAKLLDWGMVSWPTLQRA